MNKKEDFKQSLKLLGVILIGAAISGVIVTYAGFVQSNSEADLAIVSIVINSIVMYFILRFLFAKRPWFK